MLPGLDMQKSKLAQMSIKFSLCQGCQCMTFFINLEKCLTPSVNRSSYLHYGRKAYIPNISLRSTFASWFPKQLTYIGLFSPYLSLYLFQRLPKFDVRKFFCKVYSLFFNLRSANHTQKFLYTRKTLSSVSFSAH